MTTEERALKLWSDLDYGSMRSKEAFPVIVAALKKAIADAHNDGRCSIMLPTREGDRRCIKAYGHEGECQL